MPRRSLVAGVVAIVALAAATFATVRATNFAGSDEWIVLSLLSRGILSFPWANRPLNLIWAAPAWLVGPDQLGGFLLFHVIWLALGGVLTLLLVRRLAPGAGPLAFLAGAFAVVWAPADSSRLCAVQMILYSGSTLGTLLATWLALRAWSTGRALLAVLAIAAAAVTVLSIEAALAPLALLPLLLFVSGGRREPRRLAAATLLVVVVLGALGARAAYPLWADPGSVTYQAGLSELGMRPARLLSGSFRQLRLHLAPLFELPPLPVAWPGVVASLAVFAAGLVSSRRGAAADDDGSEGREAISRGGLLATAAIGCLWAFVSYLPFAGTTRRAFRTEFLSAPGVGVMLAGALVLAASFLPNRTRLVGLGLLGAWVVVLGVQHTVDFQRRWNDWTPYPGQRRTLERLVAVAPDPAPGTLLVLIARDGAWSFDMTFHHAVLYLYEERVAGHLAFSDPLLYDTRFEPSGVVVEPARVLRGPWHEPVTTYPYESLVVVREDAAGVRLLETWPDDLPALPEGAVYAPRARLGAGPPPRRLSIFE